MSIRAVVLAFTANKQTNEQTNTLNYIYRYPKSILTCSNSFLEDVIGMMHVSTRCHAIANMYIRMGIVQGNSIMHSRAYMQSNELRQLQQLRG